MPDETEAVLFLVGAVFFLLGLLGGGHIVGQFTIPPINRYARIVLAALGTLVMGIAGYILVSAGPLLVAVSSTMTPTATDTPLPTATFTPTPPALDTMDTTLGWVPYTDDKGSSVSIASESGSNGNAIEILYDLKVDGWVGISKVIDRQRLFGTDRIGFRCFGSGATSTVELKLLYDPNSRGESTVFSVLWNGVTAADDWTYLEAPYSAFECWEETGCSKGEPLNLARVWKIDFAVSNKPGNTAGMGTVRIDDVRALKPNPS